MRTEANVVHEQNLPVQFIFRHFSKPLADWGTKVGLPRNPDIWRTWEPRLSESSAIKKWIMKINGNHLSWNYSELLKFTKLDYSLFECFYL